MTEHDARDSTSQIGNLNAPELEAPARSTGIVPQAAPAGTSARVDVVLGGGLAFLGFLAVVLVFLDPATFGDLSRGALAFRCIRALWLLLAFALVGSAAYFAVRSLSSLRRELFERESRRIRRIDDRLDSAIGLLDRIARALEQRVDSEVSQRPAETVGAHPADNLQNLMAEFERGPRSRRPGTGSRALSNNLHRARSRASQGSSNGNCGVVSDLTLPAAANGKDPGRSCRARKPICRLIRGHATGRERARRAANAQAKRRTLSALRTTVHRNWPSVSGMPAGGDYADNAGFAVE